MVQWITYIKERFPPLVYLLLSGGFVVSGFFIAYSDTDKWNLWKEAKISGLLILSLVILLLFFFLLRLMDELKDYHKDIIIHPERPLPRGLLKKETVDTTIAWLWRLTLIGASLLLWSLQLFSALLWFGIFWIYLWLMYKEFYVGQKLQNYPLIYAISHQIILIPICFFCIQIFETRPLEKLHVMYALAALGSFFSYEVCRKLDPQAHPLAKTYLQTYGHFLTALILAGASALALFATSQIDLIKTHWPLQILLVISVFMLRKIEKKFKWVEGLASVSLLLYLWIGVFL